MAYVWRSLRELEALRAMIMAGTATAAARQLGISQPAVSRALALLEARTGRTLFERRGRMLAPTAEALELNDALDPVFEALNRLTSASLAERREGALRIAVTPSFSTHFVQNIIGRYRQIHVMPKIELDVCGTDQVIALVSEGRTDLGFTDSTVTHSGIRLEPFRKSRAACFLPKGHRLVKRAAIEPHDLDGEDFVDLIRRHSMRAEIDRLFIDAGVQRNILVVAATVEAAYQFVREGLGVAVMNPFPIVSRLADGVEVGALRPRLVYHTSFVLPSTLPPSAQARKLIRFIRGTQKSDAWSDAV